MEQASSVDHGGDDHADSEEGDGEVSSEHYTDDEDGEEGEAHVDQHVVNNDLHCHKGVEKKHMSLKVLWRQI